MAASRLTVRTLGMATVALVLACVHAVQAVQQGRGGSRVVTITGGSGGVRAMRSAGAGVVRISSPAHPLSARRAGAPRTGVARRISIGPGMGSRIASRAVAAPPVAAPVRPASPEVAAALSRPRVRPVPRRNAFALPLVGLAVATPVPAGTPFRGAASRGEVRRADARRPGTRQ